MRCHSWRSPDDIRKSPFPSIGGLAQSQNAVNIMDSIGNGSLVPSGGGAPMSLVRSPMVIGRRDSCDIRLPFPSISGRHAELVFKDGFWLIHDLKSTNGMKVNGERIQPGGKKYLAPGDTITIAHRDYKIEYTPAERLARMAELMEDDVEDILSVPLMVKAGLEPSGRVRASEIPAPEAPGGGCR
jgi:pSer/pThr/pTyr-binding forkhead associated (FHA) protein